MNQAMSSVSVIIGKDILIGNKVAVLKGAHSTAGAENGVNMIMKGPMDSMAFVFNTLTKVVKYR